MGAQDTGAEHDRGMLAALEAVAALAALGTEGSGTTPSAVHEHLLEHVVELPGVQHADLLLVGDGGRLTEGLHRGPFGALERYAPRPSRGGTVVDWVLATQEPARASEVSPAIAGPELCRWGVRSLAAFPLRAAGAPLAVLAVGVDTAGGPDAVTLAGAEAFAAAAGTLLALAQAQQQARHDPLTGCLNHGAMLDQTGQELARAARSGRRLGCVLLDLDDFKGVNDRLGHGAGDRLLQDVGHALLRAFRQGDLVARYGGDEFVILVPDADAPMVREAAERCARVVRALPAPGVGGHGVHVTVGADLSRPDDTATDLLARADRALGLGKRTGKDRVILAAQPT